MKPGFTLVELIIGLLLSSIIAITLYNSFSVSNRGVQVADDIMNLDVRLAIIENQLQKDCSGIFVPLDPVQQQKLQQAQEDEKIKKSKQKPAKPIEKIFYAENKGDSLSLLSFITSNPIRVYEYAKNAYVSPRIVRVVYRLVPNEDKTSFTLQRQESTNLDLKAFEQKGARIIRSYEVADNIKRIGATFWYPKKKAKRLTKKTEQEERVEYEKVSEWKDDVKKARSKIPQFITFELTLWDIQQEKEKTFEFGFEVAAFKATTMPPKKKPQQPPKKEGKKEEQQNKKLVLYFERPKNMSITEWVKQMMLKAQG